MRNRKAGKVMDFIYTQKFQCLLGAVDEYADEDDDKLEAALLKVLNGKRADQILRALGFTLYVVCKHDDFNIIGFEKLFKHVNELLGEDEGIPTEGLADLFDNKKKVK